MTQKKVDFSTLLEKTDLTVDAQFKTPEDSQEKAQRLRKELVGFYFKDIGAWILAFVFVVVIGACSFWIVMRTGFDPAEKEWARSVISAIVAGIIGFIFGKTAK
jgi:heme/copper-type cytochrome/quinol oxidase subunit 4